MRETIRWLATVTVVCLLALHPAVAVTYAASAPAADEARGADGLPRVFLIDAESLAHTRR